MYTYNLIPEMKIFSGRSNPDLATRMCDYLGVKLGKISIGNFPDGEIFCKIEEDVRGRDIFIVQSTGRDVNEALMELLIMIDSFRRASASRITAVIPYYGYARQDRKDEGRVPITAKLVANLLTKAGVDRVLSIDLHAAQIQGFFDIPVDNLQGGHLFVKHYVSKFGKSNEDVMVVSPDVGSTARARAFAMKLGTNMAIVDKRRERANQSEVMNIIGDVSGKICILLDDIVDTAGSIVGAAKAIKEIGGAKEVYACATHGVLSGPALDRINSSCIKEMLLLDTIPYPKDQPMLDKVSYISSAPVFAEAIRRIYEEVSIANMFEN